MATESEAILRLKAQTDYQKAKDETHALAGEHQKLEPAAKGAASALQNEAAAIEQVGTASAETSGLAVQTAAALEGVGVAAVESSQQGSQAARQQAEAIEGVVAAAGQERQAVEAAGSAAVEENSTVVQSIERVAAALIAEAEAARATGKAFTPEEIASRVRQLTDVIRQSDAELIEQRGVLQGFADSIVAEMKQLEAAGKQAGSVNVEQANALAAALGTVNAEIERVNGSMIAESSKVATAFGSIERGAVSFSDAAASAIETVNGAWKALNEEQYLTPRQLNRVSQAYESLRLIIAEQADAGIVATEEQIKFLKQMEVELDRITLKTNQLTNFQKDNAVRLKETGQQVATLGLAVQQLSSFAGPAGKVVGDLAGKIGLLGIGVEQAKDAFGGLNINQIGAAKGALGLGAQVAALIVTVYASVAAGKALSETNAENSESWETLKNSIHDFIPTLDELKDRFGSTQSEIDKLIAGNGSVYALQLAMGHGREAANAYYNMINQGVPKLEAFRAIEENATEVTEAYTRAQKLGAAGMQLWNQAVQDSHGSAATFAEILPTINSLLAEMETAQQKSATAHALATAAVVAHTAALNEYQRAELDADEATARMAVDLALIEEAHNGTTAKISDAVQVIAKYIAQSDLNSVKLGVLATKLQPVLDLTEKLSGAERQRIQDLINLAKRGDELTETERKHALALIDGITNGRAIAAALTEQATATREVTAATAEANIADDERTKRIRSQLEVIRELIDEKEREIQSANDLAAANQFAGDNIDFLRMKEAQLTRELEPQLTVWHATEQATSDATDAKVSSTEATRAQVAATADLDAINQRVRQSLEGFSGAITNLDRDERAATTAAAAAAAGTRDVKVSADEAAAAMQKLAAPFVQIPGNARDLAAELPALNDHVKALAEHTDAWATAQERANVALARQIELAQQANR